MSVPSPVTGRASAGLDSQLTVPNPPHPIPALPEDTGVPPALASASAVPRNLPKERGGPHPWGPNLPSSWASMAGTTAAPAVRPEAASMHGDPGAASDLQRGPSCSQSSSPTPASRTLRVLALKLVSESKKPPRRFSHSTCVLNGRLKQKVINGLSRISAHKTVTPTLSRALNRSFSVSAPLAPVPPPLIPASPRRTLGSGRQGHFCWDWPLPSPALTFPEGSLAAGQRSEPEHRASQASAG